MRTFARRQNPTREKAPSGPPARSYLERGHLGTGTAARFEFGRTPMHPESGFKTLPKDAQTRMESSFGVDLSGVRVHDDITAKSRANAINAKAYVQAGQIHWSETAPPLESPAAMPLLAHEISHVVQQRRATSVEDRISSPEDPSELAATAAAGQALRGQAVIVGGSSVAAIQRQPNDALRTDPADKEIEIEIITKYLQKVVNTNPRQDLKTATVVRDALKMLSAGSIAIDVDKFVESAATPSDPAGMSRAFAAILAPIHKVELDRLATWPFIDKSTLGGRVGKLAKKYPVGKSQTNPVPGDVSPEDKNDDLAKRTKSPATHSGMVDILGAIRVIKGLKGTLNPSPTKPNAPQADLEAAVAAAITSIDKGALLPPEAKAKGGESGGWIEDAQEFALALAKGMDVAQKSGDHEFTIPLPPAYENIQDKAAIIVALQGIMKKIRGAREDHASNVTVTVTVQAAKSKRIFMMNPP